MTEDFSGLSAANPWRQRLTNILAGYRPDPNMPFWGPGQGPAGMFPSRGSQMANFFGRGLTMGLGSIGPGTSAAVPFGFGGVINRGALRRLGQQEQQSPPVQSQHVAAATAEQPAFGRNLFDSPGWDRMVGMPSGDAIRALSLARGDMAAARTLLTERGNQRALNTLNYWAAEQPGFSSRRFADPAQARAYWDALQQFNTMRRPDQ